MNDSGLIKRKKTQQKRKTMECLIIVFTVPNIQTHVLISPSKKSLNYCPVFYQRKCKHDTLHIPDTTVYNIS
jgi:hypothetical protein